MSRFQDFDFSAGADDPLDIDQLATELPEPLVEMTNSTTVVDLDVSPLSDNQEKILASLQVFSALLSLIGSCTIVFKILRSLCRKQTTTPYDRIIFGLSSCDIVASCTYAMGPFLLPSETSQRVWAIGNDSTCQRLGFLTQLSAMWAIWYNALLSFYYLLTVRFQVKRKEFVRKYEPWMHISGAIFFPVTSLIGLIGRWYDEQALAMGCWVGEVNTGCDDSGTCSATWGELVAYIYGALPLVITLFAVVINNIIIYLFVRKSLMSRNRVTADIEDNKPNGEGETSTEQQTVQEQLTKEAAIQGFLYVSTFLLTVSPAFIVQILDGSLGYEEDDQGQIYPLLVLNSILLPLQGFFNVFIYVRPSYSRFNAANPQKSSWFILKQALFDPNIPRMSSTQGVSSDPISAVEKKHSKMKQKCGSNFSMSLDNIVEEAKEDGSVDSAVEKDGNTDESTSMEIQPPPNAQNSP